MQARLATRFCPEELQKTRNSKIEKVASSSPRVLSAVLVPQRQKIYNCFSLHAAHRRHVGTNAENSLIACYRGLPPLTALHGGRKWAGGQAIEGSQAARFRPCVLPSCCSGRRSPAPCQDTTELAHFAHHPFGTQSPAKQTAEVCFTFPPASTGSILHNRFPLYFCDSRSRPAGDVKAARSRNRSSPILRGPPLSTTTTHDVIGATVFRLALPSTAWSTMATGDTAPPLAPSSPPPPLLDNSPSNVSSPLSEPEDKDGYGDEADLDLRDHSDGHDTPNQNGARSDPESDVASESDDDSKLSELDVNDSEAETERLYDTPPKNGATRDIVNTAGDAVNRRFTDRRDRVFERSPSKLHQQLRADIDAGDAASGRNSASEGEDGEDDELSLPSSEPELDSVKERRLRSPTLAKKSQVVRSAETPTSHPRKNSADSRKRKRPSVAENSESEQPLKKRTGSISAADGGSTHDIAMIDDDELSTNPQSGSHTAEEDDEELVVTTEAKEELPDAVEEDAAMPTRLRKGKRSPTKQRKSKSPAEAGAKEEAPDEPPEDADVQSVEVPTPQAEDEHADEIDEEAEAAHRNEEERTRLAVPLSSFTNANWNIVERKKAAWEELVAIEKQFSSFRER